MASILKAARPAHLLDRREVEARERARQVFADAEASAARTRAAAEAEREEIRRAAAGEGRAEGLASAAAALAEVAAARARKLEGLEREVAGAALEVARGILGAAVAERPELALELARRALGPVRARREVSLRVNPEDAPRFRAELPRLAAQLERAPGLAVREDPGVPPGGVVVETEAGRVDARVEAQLALLERALGEGQP